MSLHNNRELVDVIRHYDLRVGTVESYPSFHVLKTDRGTKVLKLWNDIDTLDEAFKLRESLATSGFRKISRFIRTKKDTPYVEYNGLGYSLTDIIDGMAPSTVREKDIQLVGRILAELHLAMSKIKVNQSFKPWSHHYYRGLEQFKLIENNIKQKTNKEPLDELILEDMPRHQEQINQSIQMARKVEKNSFKNGMEPKWCHGNLQLTSFRIDEYGEGWLNDLGLPVVDIHAYDIAKLVSRVYIKSGYKPELVYQLLDAYQKIIPLQPDDKLWVLTYIAYPHDLWKFMYINYIAKVSHPANNLNQQYQNFLESQINLGKLYQLLFTYFDI